MGYTAVLRGPLGETRKRSPSCSCSTMGQAGSTCESRTDSPAELRGCSMPRRRRLPAGRHRAAWSESKLQFSTPQLSRLRQLGLVLNARLSRFLSTRCVHRPLTSCTAMNGMHDSNKRTSISQLLNPTSDSSVYSHTPPVPSLSSSPAGPSYEHLPHPLRDPYSRPESTFHLRAANWEPLGDDQSIVKRRPDGCQTPTRPYPVQPQMFPEMNGEMQLRQLRPRLDEYAAFPAPGNLWQPPLPEMSSVHYGSAIVTQVYPEERAGEATRASMTSLLTHIL